MPSRRVMNPWLVCFCAALFFFYEILQMNMFNVIGSDLMRAYAINSTQLGWLSSAYFYANLIFLLPAGVIMERVSTRRYILVMASVAVVATCVFALSHSLLLTVLCRAAVGLGNGVAFLACMRLATRWFEPKRLALVMGLIITVAMLGGMAAQTPVAFLVAHFAWRGAVWAVALLGVLIIALIYGFVQDSPQQVQQDNSQPAIPLFVGLKRAMSAPSNWYCGVYTALMSFPVMLLGALWGNLYLQQAHGFSAVQAASITGMLFFGLIVGSPVVGLISDRLGDRKLPMVLGGVLTLLSALSITFMPETSTFFLMMLFFVLGFLSSTQVLTYPLLAETNPAEISSMVMSIPAISLNLAVAVAQPLFGWLMHLHWGGKTLHGTPVFSLANYHMGLMLLIMACVISIFLALLVRKSPSASLRSEGSLIGVDDGLTSQDGPILD